MFKLVSSYGFKRCELWAMGDHFDYKSKELKAKIKSWIEKYSVFPTTAHLPLYTKDFKVSLGDKEVEKKSTDELLYAVEFLTDLGVETFVIHMTGDKERFIKNFSKIYDNTDKSFALENDPMGFPLVKDIVEIIPEIQKEFKDGEKRIGACLDIGHANIWEKPPENTITQLKDFLIATHISDNDGNYDAHLPPGEGTINWEKSVSNFKEINYKHNFTFEIAPLYEFEEIKNLLERLKKFLEENEIST